MSWKDWFHNESAVMEESPIEVLPLSPRLLTGIDLSRFSHSVRVFFEERVVVRECHSNMNGEGIESQERWSFDQWLESYSDS